MFRRRRSTDDFAEEIKSHLELEADDAMTQGEGELYSCQQPERIFATMTWR